MTLIVNVTDNCLVSAREHGVQNDVMRLKERVEETQSTSSFDKFPQPYMVKKKIGGRQHRLIAHYDEVDEFVVVTFLEVMIRGSREYDAPSGFGKDPEGYGRAHFDELVSPDKLQAFVESRRAAPPASLPAPDDAEYELLYNGFARDAQSDHASMVYETDEWIEMVGRDTILPYLASIADAALGAYESSHGIDQLPIQGRPDWRIWYLKNDDGVLLLELSVDGPSSPLSEHTSRIRQMHESAQTIDIRREARRAYPGHLLADSALWVDLEREQQANMALSPEESEVLENARSPDNPFPLFINGRAGSGKSTILQYLFTSFARNYLKSEARRTVEPPIYLTANAELLRTAKDRVEKLLKHDFSISDELSTGSTSELKEMLDASFKDFQSYELSLLPPDQRRNRFPLSNRVTYASFRNKWKEKFGQQPNAYHEHGPELSWHVLRTYIKGMSPDEILEPDEYFQLPAAHKSVSQETYKLVFDKVWEAWFEPLCRERNLWDDQDLARFILERDYARPRHPAVFCDEAQDFTRIELELLMRINRFSARSLSPEQLGNVCFVFAGDQFQTLNPTGFRWEAIKAAFVEKFVNEMAHGRRVRPELNYKELEFNYRSTDKIVRFSNSVQAYRAARFDLPDLRPQKPWASGSAMFPVDYFSITDGEFWRRYKEMLGVVMIVPCAEGDELRYVRDTALSQHVTVANDIPANVFSASRAKGSEYPAVIVYGFGAFFERELKRFEADHASEENREIALAFEYFINRLYVAVSRPKRQLIIVDDKPGFESFWKFGLDSAYFGELWKRWPRGRDIWHGEVEVMRPGLHANLGASTSTDLADLAKNYRSEGKARRDSYYLNQAALAFGAIGDRSSQTNCLALALEYDDRYLEAGQTYERGGFLKDAVRTYWKGGTPGRQALARLAIENAQVLAEPEAKVALAIDTQNNPRRWIEALELIRDGVADSETAHRFIGAEEWRDAVQALVECCLADKESNSAEVSPRLLQSIVAQLRKSGIGTSDSSYARLCLDADLSVEAMEVYEAAGLRSDPGYLEAKAKSSGYPDNVVLLARRGAHDEIAAEFRKSPTTSLTSEQARLVHTALVASNDLRDAIRVAWDNDLAKELNALVHNPTNLSGDLRKAAIHGMVRAFLNTREWDGIGIVCSPAFPASESFKKRFEPWPDEDTEFVALSLLREWARSEISPSQIPDRVLHALQKTVKFWADRLINQHDANGLTFEEMAAAIERAGHHSNAEQFYKAVRSPPFTEAQKLLARDRMLVVKNFQLNRLLAQGANGRTRALEREIKQGLASIGKSTTADLGGITKLPRVDLYDVLKSEVLPAGVEIEGQPVTGGEPETQPTQNPIPPSALPGLERITLRDFRIDVSRAVRRINITNEKTFQTAFVLQSDGTVGGEMTFTRMDNGSHYCQAWAMTVSRADGVDGKHQMITIGVPGITLTFKS